MAAAASLAANQQGKFWQMHDALFRNFRKLSRENILSLAKEIGLDMTKFNAGLDSPKCQTVVQKDVADAELHGTKLPQSASTHWFGQLATQSHEIFHRSDILYF